MKKTILSLALALALPVAAQAQAIPSGEVGQKTCSLAGVWEIYTPTKCVGFFGKNSMDFGTGYTLLSTDDAYKALGLMGESNTNVKVALKVESWNGSANFSKAMSGLTVVGVHWGNYFDVDKEIGNVSAFYLFDFGNNEVTDLNLTTTMRQGVSNAAIITTGGGIIDECGPNTFPCTTVPEPSTYALMAAGLLGIGFASRRRRKA